MAHAGAVPPGAERPRWTEWGAAHHAERAAPGWSSPGAPGSDQGRNVGECARLGSVGAGQGDDLVHVDAEGGDDVAEAGQAGGRVAGGFVARFGSASLSRAACVLVARYRRLPPRPWER